MVVLRKTGHALLTGLDIVTRIFLILPILMSMVLVNYTIDRSSLFHTEGSYELEVAKALLAGDDVAGYDQMNERKVYAMLAESLEKPFDTIALGSSRVLQLTKKLAGTGGGSFLNCGMTGADYRDVVGTFYLFDRAGMLPKNLIVGLDPWLLNADPAMLSPRSDPAPYNEFLTLKLGIDAGYEAPDEMAKYKALFSPSYLQGNLNYYFKEGGAPQHETAQVVTGDIYTRADNIKLSDGSVLYAEAFRKSTPSEVEERARSEASTFTKMEGFLEPDATLCGIFDRFVRYAREQGVNVIFLLTPYHPMVYNYATERRADYPGFFLAQSWFENYARQNSIPLYGSYNPFITESVPVDFYDGLHTKGEAIAAYFPGVQKVLQAQKSGWAASPWYTGRVRVEHDTALRLVNERYAIAPPEELRDLPDGTINNGKCYVFGRYANDEDDATLLARYAVSKDEGIVYRFDTNFNLWTVDARFPR